MNEIGLRAQKILAEVNYLNRVYGIGGPLSNRAGSPRAPLRSEAMRTVHPRSFERGRATDPARPCLDQ
ncbi:MAG: hypothetical protein J0H64_09875 [Actinobacteria bacterium]|nr:hypothetical protein [Actinomycetota bacterium]